VEWEAGIKGATKVSDNNVKWHNTNVTAVQKKKRVKEWCTRNISRNRLRKSDF
jgi:hypothetical protein